MPSSRHSSLRRRLRRAVTRQQRFRGTAFWILPVAGFALGLLGLLAVTRLADARRDVSLARSALIEARTAVAARQVDTAKAALDRAGARLAAAGRPASGLPLSLLRPIPLVGSPIEALADGVRAGKETVAAGRILADAVSSFPISGAAAIDGHNLSAFHEAAASSTDALDRAGTHLATARKALAGPAGAWLPPVSGPARSMLTDLDAAGHQLASAQRGLRLFSQLTGPDSEARLLLLSQDTMEIRPTGGFIGSFGVLRFSRGTVALERYQSFEELPEPDPPMEAPEELAPALARPWDLSNSNWWPDFPKSASTAVEMFRRQGGGEVDGVVAITEHVMADLIGAFGPIQVPGYAKPVVEEGFAERVLYEVELKRPQDNPRKKFLTLLSQEVFSRLFSLPGEKVPAVVEALGEAAGAGDLQIWFTRSDWQQEVAGTALDGALPPAGDDFLRITEANLTAGKANADLVRDVHYQVRPDGGRLRASLRIEYRNEGVASEINPYYNGFLRVYVPQGAELSEDSEGYTEDAIDGPYTQIIRDLYVEPGQTQVVTFDYLLPKSVASEGDYHLTWLRQPGTLGDRVTATVGKRSFEAPPNSHTFTVDARFEDRGIARFVPFL
jgi:uncharacterized protein DUF4012